MGEKKIENIILNKIKPQFFFIVRGTTQDISKQNHLGQLIRYVTICDYEIRRLCELKINNRFLGFRDIIDKTLSKCHGQLRFRHTYLYKDVRSKIKQIAKYVNSAAQLKFHFECQNIFFSQSIKKSVLANNFIYTEKCLPHYRG